MMVGDGPEKKKQSICQELGILDKVIFFGNSNEIDKILSYTDLFLLPSNRKFRSCGIRGNGLGRSCDFK
jgi:glycosyltransferase involved in cell wall biosynthesis